MRVGKVDFFDGAKRKLFFFVEGAESVEEEGFYKVASSGRSFYVFVTNLSEVPLDSEMRARFSKHEYEFDTEERYVLYAQATILLEYREDGGKKIVGYKTIPRHNDGVHTLEDKDFDVLGLPKLDFAYVRSGSQHFDTKAGFSKDAYITHWLLSGWTNSGKTNAAKVLLNVTMKGDGEPFAGGVIIDPHGEYYKDLKHFNSIGAPRVFHYTVGAGQDPHERELQVSMQSVYPSYLTAVYDFREDTQVSFMNMCCRKKRGEWVRFIIDNEADGIKSGLGIDDKRMAGVDFIIGAVKGRVQSIFQDDDVWVDERNSFLSSILEGVSRGCWYVIDVSAVSNKTAKLITTMVASGIFAKYKAACTKNKKDWRAFKPAGVLIEEAHNYLSPEESSRGNIVAKIAKEGRKFKVFAIIVEQDPAGIDDRILKQIHNKVILQLIPADAKAMCQTTPYVNELERKIPYYGIGEGVFVSTGSFSFALPVKFPLVGDWVAANCSPCTKCGNPTISGSGCCPGCENALKRQDMKAFM